MRSSHDLLLTLEPLVLASASPRRSELLRSVGLVFEVAPSGAQENGVPGESPSMAALRWARQKAKVVAEQYPDKWVLAADTIVVLEGRILGKPRNKDEAAAMLGKLSGSVHDVISGICLLRTDRNFQRSETVRTEVRFKRLTCSEIDAYVSTREPLDKTYASICFDQGTAGQGRGLWNSGNGGLHGGAYMRFLYQRGGTPPVHDSELAA